MDFRPRKTEGKTRIIQTDQKHVDIQKHAECRFYYILYCGIYLDDPMTFFDIARGMGKGISICDQLR